MNTVSTHPEAVTVEEPALAVRLSLKPESGIRGRLDGAWWPRSRDLARELPALVAVLDRAWGRITRATVHEGMWPDLPARVPVGVHVVQLGWFGPEQERDDLCLLSFKVGRWDLLVVPPECDPARAAQLMAAAADVNETRGATALLSGLAAEQGPAQSARELGAEVARDRAASWPVPPDPAAPLVRI
jgi:hypothetical protein